MAYTGGAHAIAEMLEFTRSASAILSTTEIRELIDHLAQRPRAGVLIPGIGGIRKLRWARSGMGKSGGARGIYYFHDERIPLYLLRVFWERRQSQFEQGRGERASQARETFG